MYSFLGNDLRKVFNILSLRLFSGVFRFITLIMLGSYLSLTDFGIYSLITIYSSYFIYIGAFSFHTYVIREINNINKNNTIDILFQSLLANSFTILLCVIVIVICFWLNIIKGISPLVFILIVTFSIYGNQIENFFVGYSLPMYNAYNLFLKHIWIIPLFIYFKITGIINLNIVSIFWLFSEATALSFLLLGLYRNNLIKPLKSKLDLKWILKGYKISGLYTSLGITLIFTITMQRIILNFWYGEASVGIYQIIFVLTMFLPNLVEASYFSVKMPKLIAESRKRKLPILPIKYSPILALVISVLILLLFVKLTLPIFLSIIGKEKIIDYLHIQNYISIYAFFYFISRIFYYHLYASNKDKYIAIITYLVFLISLVISILLIKSYGILGSGYSVIFTGLLMFLFYALPFIKEKQLTKLNIL